MPCKIPPLVLLAFADAVADGVEVSRHLVQLVGFELLALLRGEDVLVAVVELDDDLLYAVDVYAIPRQCLSVPSITRSFPRSEHLRDPCTSFRLPILEYRRRARKSERPQGTHRDEQGGEKKRG